MGVLRCWTVGVVVALGGISLAHSADKKDAGDVSAREKLIGAWRLVSMEEAGPTASSITLPIVRVF